MDIARYAAILRVRKAELENRLARIEADFQTPRDPDDDDRAIERNNDEVLEEIGEVGGRELAAVDAALERIAKGIFGICTRCGDEIEEGRLDLIPYAPLCSTCAGEVETARA